MVFSVGRFLKLFVVSYPYVKRTQLTTILSDSMTCTLACVHLVARHNASNITSKANTASFCALPIVC